MLKHEVISKSNIKKELSKLTDTFAADHFLEKWYYHFDKKKIKDIDKILEKYIYCENILFGRLYKKYVDEKYDSKTKLWFYDDKCDTRREEQS